MTEPMPKFMEDALRELQERVDHVHEKVACPGCHARVGEKCRRKHRMGVRLAGNPGPPPELKHPHRERLAAAGIPLR